MFTNCDAYATYIYIVVSIDRAISLHNAGILYFVVLHSIRELVYACMFVMNYCDYIYWRKKNIAILKYWGGGLGLQMDKTTCCH